MDQQVFLQVLWKTEALATFFAMERSFSRVDKLVSLQVRGATETLVTQFTTERSSSRVVKHVCLQLRRVLETSLTLFTHVSFPSCVSVSQNMCHYVRWSS